MDPCQRNSDITEQGHPKNIAGVSIRDILSQNIMFNFLHDYLLLNVIVDYISDTCIYVTAHRIQVVRRRITVAHGISCHRH